MEGSRIFSDVHLSVRHSLDTSASEHTEIRDTGR